MTSLLNDKPIIIVGAARSGTTLLQYMLRSHPDVSLPTAESCFFIPFYQRRNEFNDLADLTQLTRLLTEIYQEHQRFFDKNLHGLQFDPITVANTLHARQVTTIPDVIAHIFQDDAYIQGKKRWGDKTPYYVLHLDTILEMFPNAQIVHLIRDGRDCALSMLERRWDLKIFNIYHAAYTWNKYVSAGQYFGQQHPQHYYEIQYEDILNEPEKTITNLCQFLNIEFNDKIINFNKSSSAGKTRLLTLPLQTDNQAKWKHKLSPRQLRLFEALAGETLHRCGYDLTCKTTPTVNRIDWFINEVHIKLCYFYSKYFLRY